MEQHTPILKPLTAIRGIAVAWIYLYLRSNLTTGSDFFRQFAEDGYYGIDIFFILSGFILTYSHAVDFATVRELKANIARFLQLRLARFYPLYLLLLLLFVNLQATGAGPLDFLQHVLMIQSWGLAHNEIWNAPAWTISVEWLLCLCFPFFVCVFASEAGKKIFNLFFVGAGLAIWVAYLKLTGLKIHDLNAPLICLPRGIFDFVIGYALHNLYREKFLEKLPWDAIAPVAILAVAGTSWLRARDMHVPEVVMIGLFTVLIYALANIRSWGNALFSNAAIVWLGTLSYSIYMLQWMYLLLVSRARHITFEGQPFLDWHFAAETAGLIAFGVIGYHLVEDPAREWLRGLIEEDYAEKNKT